MTEAIRLAFLHSPEHQLQGHPESPERLSHFLHPQLFGSRSWLLPLELLKGDEADVLRVHDVEYLSLLQAAERRAPALLDGGDTYFARGSLEASRKAMGGALAATRVALEHPGEVGFSICRPPGHHATSNRAMGFCLLNNVAIACRYAQAMGVSRVLIVDFDVHHGNGTQAIFDTDPDVFYLSLHQRGIFPGTGHLEDQGGGGGRGTVFNLPLPAYSDHKSYLDVFEKALAPVLERAQPELILASAGYDAHWADPLANLQLTEDSYYQIGRLLQMAAENHSQGRLVFVLEGGYNPEALYNSVLATWHGVLGLAQPETTKPGIERPGPALEGVLEAFLRIHFP